MAIQRPYDAPSALATFGRFNPLEPLPMSRNTRSRIASPWMLRLELGVQPPPSVEFPDEGAAKRALARYVARMQESGGVIASLSLWHAGVLAARAEYQRGAASPQQQPAPDGVIRLPAQGAGKRKLSPFKAYLSPEALGL